MTLSVQAARTVGNVALVTASLLTSGCAARQPEVRFSQLNVAARAPKSVENVEVFTTKKPTRDYVEMGTLSFLTYKYNPDDRVVIDRLRAKAAEVGADAIIMLDTRSETNTNYVSKQTYQGKVLRAMAITYKD
jgi:hypothetical protein